ncbi:MAG: hypothetical protein V4719_05010 [Planctomycetota bacterium]
MMFVVAGGIGLLGGMLTAADQLAAQDVSKKPATAGTTPVAGKPSAAKIGNAATPDQAAKVLDLRTFPVMKGAEIGNMRTLSMLMYEVKSAAKPAFEFQRAELTKRGFKELPGGYSDAMNASGKFSKDGFYVGVSASAFSTDPAKMGMANVSLVNEGNVALEKLPVPPGVKPFVPQAYRAAYTTDAKVAATAAACRKLLLAAGWEPYGQADANQADSSTQYFKQNAIKLQAWISVTPAEGGKTLIQYSTELLQADLPAPPDIAHPEYTDFQKTLRFDAPQDQTDAIVAFYQQRLPKQGWKATTEKPITDDRDKSMFIIYRNAQKELLSLDLTQFTGIVRVKLLHQTAAELAEEERRAKAYAEKMKAETAALNKKVNVELLLPANAGEIEKLKENVWEIKVATGSCPAVLEGFRKHFLKDGWTEEEGAKLEEQIGNLDFKKGLATLSFSYFDVGFGEAEIKVSGSPNVVLKAKEAETKAATDEPKGKKKKPAAAGIPGLPPGVDLPPDVQDLVKKALEDAKGTEKKPAKKP